jgi:hypothetical protein
VQSDLDEQALIGFRPAVGARLGKARPDEAHVAGWALVRGGEWQNG